jgi:hypothetical protein
MDRAKCLRRARWAPLAPSRLAQEAQFALADAHMGEVLDTLIAEAGRVYDSLPAPRPRVVELR